MKSADEAKANAERMLGSTLVTIQTGEGMLALWGALKSVIRPGDRVLAVGTGLFGYGIGDMARQVGAEVETVGFPFDAIVDPDAVRAAALRFRPKLITAVHCETPSGTLNPLDELGRISREVDALYYVDFVASGGGAPVDVDRCAIDLGLLGSQKVLSLPPDLSMVSVSERAWRAVADVGYAGYDALAPWKDGPARRYLPALVVGAALWATVYTTVGFAVLYAVLGGAGWWWLVVAALVALVAVGTWRARRRAAAPDEDTDEDADEDTDDSPGDAPSSQLVERRSET